MGYRKVLERTVRRLGRSIALRLIVSLPDSFWKEVQDTAGDIATYTAASLARVIRKNEGDGKEARSIIDFSEAYADWVRATRWVAAVRSADERFSLENPTRSKDQRALPYTGGATGYLDDRDDKEVDSEPPQGRMSPEYLERRARELGL